MKTILLMCAFLAAGSAFADSAADSRSILISAPKGVEIQLDSAATLAGRLQIPAGFSGDISISTDASALPQGSAEVSFTTTPSFTHVAAPSTSTTLLPFQIAIKSQAGSHSFKNLPFQVVVKAGNATASQTVGLTVDAIYEIDLTGGVAPEGWSSPMTLSMPKHEGGVTIRFVNMDTASTHTIHGEDAIPHQETDPLIVATPGHPGGVYEIHVPDGDPVSGEYRCHDHESEDMLRTISFNN